METDRTDLLPAQRRRALHRAYLFRLATVTALAGAGLFLVAGGLLLPTRALLSKEIRAREAQLATVEAALASTADATLSKQLAVLQEDLSTLAALNNAPKATAILSEALGVARPGVVLTGFVYMPSADKRAGTLDITGSSTDRTSLQAYQAALQGSSFAANVDLPVSAYAKETSIPFTITVTLKP